LRLWSKATLKSLAVPGGALLLAVALLTHSGSLTLAPPALSFLYYCALVGGMLLAWRFHSSRTFFALVVLFLAEQAVALSGSAMPSGPGWTALRAVSILVPLNFVLIALMQERGFTVSSAAPVGLFLFVQSVIVAVLCRAGAGTPVLPVHAHHAAAPLSLPNYALLTFAAAGFFLLVRCILTRKPVDSALFWSLASYFLSLRFTDSVRISTT